VDASGQNSITVIPGANAQLLPRDLERSLPQLRAAGMILTQLEIPMETVEYLCAVAGRFQVPLMLDPAPARALPREMLRHVTYLTPNETETYALCAIPPHDLNLATVAELARTLQANGPANVIIKMGKHGAFAAGPDNLRVMVRPFKVRVVDSTAAGDAFNGGLAVALMRGLGLEEAVRFAGAVGALSVTRAGAQPAMPTAVEVKKFLSGHSKKKPARTSK
jgi:ribokinase